MLKVQFFVFFMFLNSFLSKADEQEDVVLMLTKQNFTETLQRNEYLLVNFYAPWSICGHCKALAPEFTKAAKNLAKMKSKIILATVDATVEEELAYEQQVRSYPTLKFFHRTESIPYTGGHTATNIVDWINKQLEPPTKHLSNQQEINEFLENNEIAILGFFKQPISKKAEIFKTLAKEMKDYAFGIITNEELFIRNGVNGGDVIIFKPYDEGRTRFDDDFELLKLKNFVQLESLPLIMEFDHERASTILRGPTKAFLLFFITNEKNQLQEFVEPLIELAKYYREYVLFVTVTYDNDKRRAFDYFGIRKQDTPTLRLITLDEKDELIKYKPETKEISEKTVDDFLQNYLEGILKRHYLSQPLPDDWDDYPLKVLVASNFYDVVFDENSVTLVEFWAPWCGHCKQLEPILEQLAEYFQDDYSVVIAKIDGVANEVEDLKVTTFPTIKLFRKGDNKMIDFDRARTFEELVEFVETNGGYEFDEDDDHDYANVETNNEYGYEEHDEL